MTGCVVKPCGPDQFGVIGHLFFLSPIDAETPDNAGFVQTQSDLSRFKKLKGTHLHRNYSKIQSVAFMDYFQIITGDVFC